MRRLYPVCEMHSPVRVAFNLRSYATDSESGSWRGSVISSLSTDSEADSVCGEFRCEVGLPEFDDNLATTTSTLPPSTSQEEASHVFDVELPSPVKESWSEIDERARALEDEKTPTKPKRSSENSQPSKASYRKQDPK